MVGGNPGAGFGDSIVESENAFRSDSPTHFREVGDDGGQDVCAWRCRTTDRENRVGDGAVLLPVSKVLLTHLGFDDA